ncbi:GSCFA domain-containing protein [Flavobacterium amniphilum]|uniref:GSCFA domain-containing protein n=1 Tax=Flavobacterium amniphilum TaxID=1834035 RepID=UPI00202AAB3A|nr:GSCFA domain-containing protein [Flavobacterium amniphilum]MCL9804628.1 GSCFA domain-containing protein [Flavobacterium amniphilum]
MQFRTQIPINKTDFPIDYQSEVLSLGSCFAENMGEKFGYFKFRSVVNPFGIIFNPVSLKKIISRSVHKKYFTEDDIFQYNGLWHCYEVHSELSNPDKESFLKVLNELIESTYLQLIKSSHFIVTLGTAWIYRSLDSGEIVANCHKVPQKQFGKELLSVAVIEQSLAEIISLISSVNSNAKFIFTVSPVRHIKDGFVENNVSKSHLIAAVYKVVAGFSSSSYFPSYEIMMDELRDYRFYAEDMLHPNATAIDYIWSRFFENYIDAKAFSVMEKVSDIQKAISHRPFNPDSESHRKFLENLSQKINTLAIDYPFMKF